MELMKATQTLICNSILLKMYCFILLFASFCSIMPLLKLFFAEFISQDSLSTGPLQDDDLSGGDSHRLF